MSQQRNREFRSMLKIMVSAIERDLNQQMQPELYRVPPTDRHYCLHNGQIKLRPDTMRSFMQAIKRRGARRFTMMVEAFAKLRDNQ